MNKIERMNAIIYALNESGRLTAKEIAKLLEVSERTIYRDISGLSQMKVPIITFEGTQGGYEIDQHYFIPSIKLSEEEITILIMLLMLGKEMKVPELYRHFEMLKLKLLNAVEKDGTKRLTRFLDKFRVYINKINPGEYVENVLQIIIKSLEDGKKVKLSYYTPLKDTLTEREISPYKFVFEEGGWYLIGYCHLRGEKRVFRLDRIKSIELLEKKCELPSDIASLENENTSIKSYHLQIDRCFYELIKHDFYMENHRIIGG
ncbi:MAG: hypothetical protein K0R50_56, partial [Eubacterium sp.]|nr:hypothetical protein [Eubacterium sp.]